MARSPRCVSHARSCRQSPRPAPGQCRARTAHPALGACFALLLIERREHPSEGVTRKDALHEQDMPALPIQFRLAPHLDGDPVSLLARAGYRPRRTRYTPFVLSGSRKCSMQHFRHVPPPCIRGPIPPPMPGPVNCIHQAILTSSIPPRPEHEFERIRTASAFDASIFGTSTIFDPSFLCRPIVLTKQAGRVPPLSPLPIDAGKSPA